MTSVANVLCAIAVLIAAGAPARVRAGTSDQVVATAPAAPSGLAQLSLEDLLSSDVTSVAKKRQTVSESPAAVFVITQDDIRRSGLTSLAELLRMAPGVEVASLGGGGYAVAIRGFNGRFSNKVLVLIDGRPIYLSTVSAVRWERQLAPVDTIERIEVVRGPGAAIWGANAVDGVINIITKHAVDTQNGYAMGRADDHGNARGDLRYGVRLGSAGVLRAYASVQTQHRVGDTIDDRDSAAQTGFRFDVEPNDRDAVTLEGDAQAGDFKTRWSSLIVQAPTAQDSGRVSGADALARWTRQLGGGASATVQAYFDRVKATEFGIHFQRDQYDIEASTNFSLSKKQNIVWGLEYRSNLDATSGDLFLFNPASRVENWYGAFAQDEITLLPQLKVSLGGKLEHNIYTGLEIQPTVRAIWQQNAWSVWGAVSRAVRTPSRFEADAEISTGLAPGSVTSAVSNAVASEKVLAYEVGWRGSLGAKLDFDLAGYYNVYTDLLFHVPVFVSGQPYYPVGFVTQPIGSGTSKGLELALNGRITERWTLKLAANLLDLHIVTGLPAGEQDEFVDQGLSPRSQLSLRSWFDLTPDVDADIWLRHVSALSRGSTPAYSDLDLRLAWRLSNRIELTAQGLNLLNPNRIEMASIGPAGPTIVPRLFQLGLAARF